MGTTLNIATEENIREVRSRHRHEAPTEALRKRLVVRTLALLGGRPVEPTGEEVAAPLRAMINL